MCALAASVNWELRTPGLIQPGPGSSVINIQICDHVAAVRCKRLTRDQCRHVLPDMDVLLAI